MKLHSTPFVPTLLCALLGIPAISLAQAPGTPPGISQETWSAIQSVHDANQHLVHKSATGYQAYSPEQDWLSSFDGKGVVVQPDDADWSWGLQLVSFGFEGDEVAVEGQAKASSEGHRIVYDWTSNVQEWYINEGRGLEHGYTLQSRPVKDSALDSPLTFTLNVLGSLTPQAQADGQGVQFIDANGSTALTYSGLHVYDALGIDQPATIVVKENSIRLVVDESNAQYPLTIDPTAQQAYLKASNTDADDLFGHAVAISGDLIVIGAPEEAGPSTGVNGIQNDNSALRAGAAYVFRRVGNSWVQEAYLKASNTDAFDLFGWSVAISGNRVIVGAKHESGGSTGVNGNESDNSQWAAGSVYVFVQSNGTWSQEAYLKASNASAGDRFGYSVAISGDVIAVGAWNERSASVGVNGNQADDSATRSGAAYVFRYAGGNWAQEAYLKASNTDAEDLFGVAIGVSGDLVVVGATRESSASTGVNGIQSDNSASGSGAAYVFRSNAGVWSQEAYIKASNAAFNDIFGQSVAVSDGRIIVGAPNEDSNATRVGGNQNDDSASQAGAAYLFVKTAGVWSQEAYLKASNTRLSNNFGYSVGISGLHVIVGAQDEDSITPGVNSGGYGNGLPNSGAAYLFDRSNGSWSFHSHLKASNPELLDRFGQAVAISNGSAVVGASAEDSSSIGVGGDQSDNSAVESGAAYVFNMDLDVATFCDSNSVNSSGLRGQISMNGSLVASDNAFTLQVDGLPQNQVGYFLNSQSVGYLHWPAGSQGSLCVGLGNSPLGRHNRPHEIRNTGAAGSFSLTLDLTQLPTASGIRSVVAGETWNFQAWFHDMNPSPTSNFTNGLSVRFE